MTAMNPTLRRVAHAVLRIAMLAFVVGLALHFAAVGVRNVRADLPEACRAPSIEGERLVITLEMRDRAIDVRCRPITPPIWALR